jgi:hypothetical protein
LVTSAVSDPLGPDPSTHVLAGQRWCRRGDLNPHVLADTSPSS